MSETPFTTGPFRLRFGPRHSPDECDIQICGDIFVLAKINGPNYDHCEANARLFVASRDLFDALCTARETIKALHGPAEWGIYESNSPEMKKIDAALRKAYGEFQ